MESPAMSRALTAQDRSSLIRLASSLSAGSAERKAILAGLSKNSADETPAVKALMRDLGRINGVPNVYITDTRNDGYYHLRVVLTPKEGRNEMGGQSGKVVDLEYSRGRWGQFYNLLEYPKVASAVRALVKRSGLAKESIEVPKKVYEPQDQTAKALREPRLSGYAGKEISIELYDYAAASM